MSDTHVPVRARDLPGELWDRVDDADVVIHAGDWVDVALLDRLESRASRVIGVSGNNDGDDFVGRLPLVAIDEVDGVSIAVIHETGQATGREVRCDEWFPGIDLLVFGHSHIPWDTVSPAGMRLLNPGSPTDRRRQPNGTYLTAAVSAGQLTDVQLHAIPRAR